MLLHVSSAQVNISIHALHEESDSLMRFTTLRPCLISIHALHEESDGFVRLRARRFTHFNPRSP